ncbi:MAG: hypothetical protein R3C44_21460 [Chloroflexota bacterium]
MKRLRNLVLGFALVTALAISVVPVLAAQPPTSPNPSLDPQCSLDVIFVLDESYSLASPSSTPAAQVRTSMKAIINAMEGTGSYVRVVEFSISARGASIGGSTGWQEVDSAYAATDFPYYIDNTVGSSNSAAGYYPEGGFNITTGTNWEDALDEVDAIPDRVSGKKPLVIMMTDGDPNTYYDSNGTLHTASRPTVCAGRPG